MGVFGFSSIISSISCAAGSIGSGIGVSILGEGTISTGGGVSTLTGLSSSSSSTRD